MQEFSAILAQDVIDLVTRPVRVLVKFRSPEALERFVHTVADVDKDDPMSIALIHRLELLRTAVLWVPIGTLAILVLAGDLDDEIESISLDQVFTL